MPKFIPGLKLNKMFYRDVVGPLMRKHFPNLKYTAGLVGHGSDVLGFDTPKSVDHDWGPHLHMFFLEEDYETAKKNVDRMLRKNLPYTYKGFSTNFIMNPPGKTYLVDKPKIKKKGDVNHLFRLLTIRGFFEHYLGFDPYKDITVDDWLSFPQQALIEVTAGEIFHDDLDFKSIRKKFEYYPRDVWLYLMRIQWGKISDELSYQGRTGEEGDEIGATIVATRTIHKIMFLCFLIEKKYVPYAKWFGKSFDRLNCSRRLKPIILKTIHCDDWKRRQKKIARAYQILAEMHHDLHITDPLSTKIIDFHGRGYPVIDVGQYIHEIEENIKDERLRNMQYPLGAVDQFIDHARINQMNYVYTKLKDLFK